MNFSLEPQTRCRPLTDDDWPAEIADMKAGFPGALNVYRTMAHHPALLKAWAPLRQHIVKDSALGEVRSELVILRAAYRMGSHYEWTHHVSRARALGIADARIRAMRNSPDGEDGLIVSAVDALFDRGHLPPEIECAVAEVVGQQAVFDLMVTVGFYSILGFILRTYETPLDRVVAAELQKKPL